MEIIDTLMVKLYIFYCRQAVSLWTCSKLCAICFVAGIFVGYTLKRRVRRWASKFLKGLKD
ncbi:hypothetical protein KY285_030712 [Solanum tuberosum]|nr:hypothetical protein KY284_030529 [Solanum tuberosum]KAH0655830.1 hypothetical protein KY285_030712 [Solanum tuberosum]